MAMQSLNILYKDAVLFLKNKKFRRVACSEPKRYIHRWFYNEAKQLVQHLRPEDLMPSQKNWDSTTTWWIGQPKGIGHGLYD